MPGLGSQPSFPSVSSGWQFSRILDSISVLVILRFSLCHQPFCLCSAPVLMLLSGISSWRFFHQFVLAEMQSCLDLASLSHFSFIANIGNSPIPIVFPPFSQESNTKSTRSQAFLLPHQLKEQSVTIFTDKSAG